MIRIFASSILYFFLSVSTTADSQQLPNILWISVEDMSPDLGCYGDQLANTPTLDQLAREGVKYTNAIANAPVCAPARSCIITGMYPTSLGSQHMRCKGLMPEGFKYFPQLLREKGYYCTNNSKEDYNMEYDSDEIWDESGKDAHWRNRPHGSTPFFAIFNLTLTHESCINSKEKHKRVTRDLPDHLRADADKLQLPPYYPDTKKVRELWARHYDNISMMDIKVGNILEELEEDGQAENTIIIFFSDHGTGVPRHKRWLYDSGIKVPLIVNAPIPFQHLLRGKPGSENDEIVCFIDLAPTVLNLAEVEIPAHMQGRAFLGNNLSPERAFAYVARDRMDERYDMQRAVRSKHFKYIRNYESYKPYTQYMNTPEKGEIMQQIRKAKREASMPEAGLHIVAQTKPDEELYNLKNDPYELRNLSYDPGYQYVITEMRAAHARWSDNTKDSGLIPETIMRAWEKQSGKTIYEILREENVPIDAIRNAALETDAKKLVGSLTHSNEAVRYWSAVSLGNDVGLKSNEGALAQLKKMLVDEIPAVRLAAARALCKSGRVLSAINTLKIELENPDEWLRLLAAQVLDEIGNDARPAEKELQKRIDIEDPNKYVVRVANRALNKMNGTDYVVR